MTQDEIKELAKQAGGMPYVNRHFPGRLAVTFSGQALIDFVALVQQAGKTPPTAERATVAASSVRRSASGHPKMMTTTHTPARVVSFGVLLMAGRWKTISGFATGAVSWLK
jgi:hypothetical protein